MATPERAVLDVIDRPRYAGGIGEVSRIVARATHKPSWDTLLELASTWGSSALVQRLGYFVDLHRVDLPDHVRTPLLGLVRPQSKIQLGSRRRWGTTGWLVRPWHVVENVPQEVLVSREEKPRRQGGLREEGAGSVIVDKFVDLHARNSGLRDKLVSERDIVLTYALRALHDTGVTSSHNSSSK